MFGWRRKMRLLIFVAVIFVVIAVIMVVVFVDVAAVWMRSNHHQSLLIIYHKYVKEGAI